MYGDAEQHLVGAEGGARLAVEPHDGFHVVEIDLGFDPRPHRLEGIGVLRPPQPAVACCQVRSLTSLPMV